MANAVTTTNENKWRIPRDHHRSGCERYPAASERFFHVADIACMHTNPVMVAAWLGALVAASRRGAVDPRLVERMARQIELANALFVKRRPSN